MLFRLLKLVNPDCMKLLYHHFISYVHYLFLPLLLLLQSSHLSTTTLDDLAELRNHPWINLPSIIFCFTLLTLMAAVYVMNRPHPVYILDFSCFKPSDAHKVTRAETMSQFKAYGITGESFDFQRRVLESSGLGEATYLPLSHLGNPSDICTAKAREEAETVIFGTIDELFLKAGVEAKDIAVLVVNCSLFNPTPSYTAMIVNRYKLRGDVISYNLGGMGCSAGIIAVDLARNLLQVHPNSYALVVSSENMTTNAYFAKNRSMLVTNALFRLGGAAILLSNRRSDRHRSKYQLVHTVRTHKGADGRSYSCVYQEEDSDGVRGITLSKDLMAVAGEALKTNIMTLGPLVLPISEQLLFLGTLILKKIFKMKIKAYIPDFKLAFEHFCIHAGGRGVLDELEKNLELSPWHMEPSRMTLYRFGNTSSSSLWYELAYCEAKGRIKKGDRVWQIAFGSGFKCNSAVWRALRTINAAKEKNPWKGEINKFPVDVPKMVPIVK